MCQSCSPVRRAADGGLVLAELYVDYRGTPRPAPTSDGTTGWLLPRSPTRRPTRATASPVDRLRRRARRRPGFADPVRESVDGRTGKDPFA